MPALGLVHPQFDHVLVSAFGRPAHGTRQIRRGHLFQHVVLLDSPAKTDVFVSQFIQHRAGDETRIKPEVEAPCQLPGLVNHVADKPPDAFGRIHVALPQDGVNEAVPQPLAFPRAVVVAAHREAGDQRMIDGLLIVTVIASPQLLAVNLATGDATSLGQLGPNATELLQAFAILA